jgi:predicted ferric reductase
VPDPARRRSEADRPQMRDASRRIVWSAIYLSFVLGPLFALLLGTLPPGRDFGTEFSIALGYSGLAMMGLQFGLTARFRHVTEPWGEDVIYHFHRRISLMAVGLVAAHPLILLAAGSDSLALPDSLWDLPWGARFAGLSIACLSALVVMALWRTQLQISYESWHVTHILLAVVAVASGLFHMTAWGFYLADPWKRGLWIAMAIFWVALLLFVRVVKPLFMLRRPYRVAEVRTERGDATTLVMLPDGHGGFRFRPGQFGWLTVWGSPFKITGHPFSFSSSAEAGDGRVEMTIRNLGDFTRAVPQIPIGKRVYLDGPYGAFTIGHPADMHVLIAGGVGITPMMSMIRTLADRGDTRPITLLYGGRDWDSLIFREELDALTQRLDLTVVYVIANPPDGWAGETGYVDADVLTRHLKPAFADHEYFICGPDVMMNAIEQALADLHVPRFKYHSERYSFV